MAVDPHRFESQFESLRELLACPACHGKLRLEEQRIVCAACGRVYPIVDGIPVLISQEQSS